jgi:protein-glutamine gamma-glutamyltransferase
LSAPTELDEEIARNIESHLRSKFQYTLDLTDAPQQGKDPIVAFLYDWKRGHCEYFAGAMTLLCQSLGLQARMVVGFKCDEYNDFGNYYNVKQSHAHAWVEVLTASQGWMTFDPTSGRESGPAVASAWMKTKHFFEFLEYSWANAVIAYNAENRENLVQNLDNRLTNTAIASSVAMGGVKGALNDLGSWLASHVLGPMLVGLGLAMAGCVCWFLWERWRLRKRASRIGIETLPASAQARLVRQLGFYDELLRLLERHDIVRPRHLTPLEFSNSLSFLPAEAYDTISRLTQVFYRIRYGLAELDGGQQRRLSNVIGQLAGIMAPATRPLGSQTSPK